MTVTDDFCASASLAAYLPGHGQIEVGPSLAAVVIEQVDAIIVAFRGTANVQGWLRDLDVVPTYHAGIGLCHDGFLTGATALWSRLNLPSNKAIYLTGHSLGAAIAIIIAALRVIAKERVDGLVTFGAPRAGYQKLVDVLAKTTVHQYRRGIDAVPDVPFDLPAFPYKHVRDPLIAIGTPGDPVHDHAITGYAVDVRAYLSSRGESGNG